MSEFKPFLALSIIVSLGVGLLWIFDFNRSAQIQIVVALSILYVFWGIIYHLLRKELHIRIVIEYLIIAVLGCLFVISLLLRS